MELLLIEEEIKVYIHQNHPKLTSSEKTKRIIKTLNLVTEIYDKHGEELTVADAYDILYNEKELEQ